MGVLKEEHLFTAYSSVFGDDAARWQAVQARDANADGHFVYAVKTTKIYCRPICKARLARRANVAFYDTGKEAVQAGFRACKRCKPELAGYMPEELAVRKIRAFVQARGAREDLPSPLSSSSAMLMSLSQMAKQTGLSKWHFHRVFKKCVGLTPSEFLRSERAAAATASTTGSSAGSGEASPWMDSVSGSEFDVGGADWFGGAAAANGTDWVGLDISGLDFGLFDAMPLALGEEQTPPLEFDEYLAWPTENHGTA